MKKITALLIISIFLFSLIPLSFAENDATGDVIIDARAEARAQRIDNMREKNRERLEKRADLDKAQIDRLSKLEVKNVDKIAQLKKDRLERLTKLSQEKIERLSELEQDKLEKVSELDETELNKLAALNRARLRDMTKEDVSKLRTKLEKVRVLKVRNADDLDERKILDSRLAQIRDNFENAKTNFNAAKNDLESSRKELKEAIDSKDEKKIIENAKKHLLKFADVALSHLEKIKSKIEESKNIAEGKAKAMILDIDAAAARINSIKSEVQAATEKQQVKDSAKKLREEWNNIRSLTKLHADRVVAARVAGIVNQGLVLEKRLDNLLAKTKEKGINISLDAEVRQFSDDIAASRDSYKQAQAKITEALDLRAKGEPAESDKIKQLMKDSGDLLKQARISLKSAHDVLGKIVKKIKEANPEAKLSEEAEVEVAEEENEATAASSTN